MEHCFSRVFYNGHRLEYGLGAFVPENDLDGNAVGLLSVQHDTRLLKAWTNLSWWCSAVHLQGHVCFMRVESPYLWTENPACMPCTRTAQKVNTI